MSTWGDFTRVGGIGQKTVVCGALLCAAALSATADELPGVSAHTPAWQISDRNDDPDTGYVLYTRPLADSDFTAYRLEAVIEAPPWEVAAAARRNVVDPEKTSANTSKTVLGSEGDVTYVYAYIDLPMIVSDRDVVTRAERSHDPVSGVYRVVWDATTEVGPAPKKGVVRLTKSSGSWEFSPLGENQTRAIYENHTDVGGVIPSWIINPLMNGQVTKNLSDLRDTIATLRLTGG